MGARPHARLPAMPDHDTAHRVLSPSTIRFCPLCGGALARARVPPDHREQPICGTCGFVFYLHPKVVAATIPEERGRVLLTRRSINPSRGKWTFPGPPQPVSK